jgi:hypothetical protein
MKILYIHEGSVIDQSKSAIFLTDSCDQKLVREKAL